MNTHATPLIPADLDDASISQLQSLESRIRDKTGSEIVLLAYRTMEHVTDLTETHAMDQ